jgi:type II secretory pathway predicted ATPase ExeA
MSAHGHFRLRSPPFEVTPDPRLFYATPSHEEALATLQYTVQAHKGCCAVLGESGSGKTLLARMLCQAVGRSTTILWIHGLEESDSSPVVNVYPPGSFNTAANGSTSRQTTLSAWWRARPADTTTPLLIVDNADELPDAAWRSIVSLLASEPIGVRPPDIALFGLPSLAQVLATPALTRLRRRLFRTYLLQPLTCEQVREYVRCRIAASGRQSAEIFTDQAVIQLYHLTRGNPGLISQVCDNAMIDAYGEDRQRIGAEDVLTAAQTIVGEGLSPQDRPDAPTWKGLSPPTLAPTHGTDAGVDDHDALTEAGLSESSLSPVLARATRRVAAISLKTAAEVGGSESQRRLKDLETRIACLRDDVRQARLPNTDPIRTDQELGDRAPTPTKNETPAAQQA